MTVLLQVSDTHFGTERAPVVAALEQFTHDLRPDVLLLSGDITQRATRQQFEAARTFVERLRVPAVLAIPGNHDIPLYNLLVRCIAPYSRYQRAFGRELEPHYENETVLVLALNTTRRYRHIQGEVSAAQIERIARRLEKARSAQWRIVMVHQPVAVTLPRDHHNVLRGHEAALRRWADAGVDLIIGGHIHLPYIVALHERNPQLPRAMWAVQAGTAVSHRVRHQAGNSVNVFRVADSLQRESVAGAATGRCCQIERWDHSAATQRFERESVELLCASDDA